jgi:hypothetical protein
MIIAKKNSPKVSNIELTIISVSLIIVLLVLLMPLN